MRRPLRSVPKRSSTCSRELSAATSTRSISPPPGAGPSRSASISSSAASVSLRPSRSKSLTPLYSGGLCEAEMTAPRSRPSSATAGVGRTPASTALPPAEAIPSAKASSSSGPLARVSRPMKTRPRPHQAAAALPRRSTRSTVSVSPPPPRTPSVPKYSRATARDDSGSDDQDQLPPDVPFAEYAQRVLRLVELVRPVDRRLQLAALEQVGERLEVGLVELSDEELGRLLAEARGEPDGC